ncbi:transcriptional regulator [Spongiibacter sp. IMCC21906]|jgi:MarR family transcriptional regulator for hemolysin|uniref:MarR family winged helix-turn-helix transcriptional regulator n=1 Tax=Spongiibacter sp. IMCC21906 TaxID=1620392 RepID=UPI00062DDA4F|nr:MarR family transcriptional regulator [Spongiibacter sp. IMCC21906]AKH70365.1 transcriptional regulator [Spongiibacter sp. IMCC21906]
MEKSSSSKGYNDALSSEVQISDEDQKLRLGFLIHDAARLRRIVIDEVFRPLRVTRSQAWALAFLSRRDGLTQSDLADDMNLGKVTLSGLIDRLEDVGMVERRSDPSDRRIKRIFITKEGRRVIKEMRQLTLDSNEKMLKGIDFDEILNTIETLRKLNRNLKSIKNGLA